MKPRPQIVFRQNGLHSWKGRLLRPSKCRDNRTGLPVEDARFDITEHPLTGRCTVLVQGASHHGRRYVTYRDIDAAQAGATRWAGRRFSYVDQ